MSTLELDRAPPVGAVPFPVTRLRQPTCAYVNVDFMSAPEAIQNFGYAVASENETQDNYVAEVKTFFAERYGGAGVGKNGGAGRCGTLGRFQIKGIGRTPLINAHSGAADFWHSHGGIALVDAIQEAVWGEVLSVALPFGATRIGALILTGTKCWYEGADGKRTQAPRALVVRESSVRPAHFMRSPFFRPPEKWAHESDTVRVQQAIAKLPDYLPQSFDLPNRNYAARTESGLATMVSRFAQQFATAQTRRLLHGAVSPSNITIDGRWVDFGTATALPTYANTKSCGAPTHFATLWEEHQRILPLIDTLCFYVNKYARTEKTFKPVSAIVLKQLYQSVYDKALDNAVLDLLGLPATFLQQRSKEITDLAPVLLAIIKSGNECRIESAILDLSSFGHNNIGRVICVLAVQVDFQGADDALRQLVPEDRLRRHVIEKFSLFWHWACKFGEAQGINEAGLRKMILLGGLKASKTLTGLFRHNMAQDNRRIAFEIDSMDLLKSTVQEKIDTLADHARALYSKSAGFTAIAWKNRDRVIQYDAVARHWELFVESKLTATSPFLHGLEGGQDALTFLDCHSSMVL